MYFTPEYKFTILHPYFIDKEYRNQTPRPMNDRFDPNYFKFIMFKGVTSIQDGFNFKIIVNFNLNKTDANGNFVYEMFGYDLSKMMEFLVSNQVKCNFFLQGRHYFDNTRYEDFYNNYVGIINSYKVISWKGTQSVDIEIELVSSFNALDNNTAFFVFAKDSYQTYTDARYESALAGTEGMTIKEAFEVVLQDNNLIPEHDYLIEFSDKMTMNGGTVESLHYNMSPIITPTTMPVFSTLTSSNEYLVSKRRFLMQYNESDLNFIKRISESEGITLLDKWAEYQLEPFPPVVEEIEGDNYFVLEAISTGVDSQLLGAKQSSHTREASIYQALANTFYMLNADKLNMTNVFEEVYGVNRDFAALEGMIWNSQSSVAEEEIDDFISFVNNRGYINVLSMDFSKLYKIFSANDAKEQAEEDGLGLPSADARQPREGREDNFEGNDERQDARRERAEANQIDFVVNKTRLMSNITLVMWSRAIKRLGAGEYQTLSEQLFGGVIETAILPTKFYFPIYEGDTDPLRWLANCRSLYINKPQLILTDKPNFSVKDLSPGRMTPFSDMIMGQQSVDGASVDSFGSKSSGGNNLIDYGLSDGDDIVLNEPKPTEEKQTAEPEVASESYANSTSYMGISANLYNKYYQDTTIDTYAVVYVNYPITFRPEQSNNSNATVRDLDRFEYVSSSSYPYGVIISNTNEYAGAVSSTQDYAPLSSVAYFGMSPITGKPEIKLKLEDRRGKRVLSKLVKVITTLVNEDIDTLEEANRKVVRRMEYLQSRVNISKFEGYVIDVMAGAQCFLLDYRKREINNKSIGEAYYVVSATMEGYDKEMLMGGVPQAMPFYMTADVINIGDDRNLVYRPEMKTPIPRVTGGLQARVVSSEIFKEEFLNYKSEMINSDEFTKSGIKTIDTQAPRIDNYGRQYLKLDNTSFRKFQKSGSLTVPISTRRFYADGLGKAGFSFSFMDNTEVLIGFQDGNLTRPYIMGGFNPTDYDTGLMHKMSDSQSYFKMSRGSKIGFIDKVGQERMTLETDLQKISGDFTKNVNPLIAGEPSTSPFPDLVSYPPLKPAFIDVADPLDRGVVDESVLPSNAIQFDMPDFIEIKDEVANAPSRGSSYIDIGFTRIYGRPPSTNAGGEPTPASQGSQSPNLVENPPAKK